MPSACVNSPTFKLSICIPTYNRANFLRETLQTLVDQATSQCEIVVSDNASNDDTEQVVAHFARQFDRLHYSKQVVNVGFDRNVDRVMEIARGEYCWLMGDDDLLKPGAVETVLEATRLDYSLIVAAIEIRDYNLSTVLLPRRPAFEADRIYGPTEIDRLFVETGVHLTFIGGVVIRREIWLARDRARYYDLDFLYVGVIFQEQLPGDTLAIAEPLINHRFGSTSWSSKMFEIDMIKWPSLVNTLAVSEAAKRKVSMTEPWRNFKWLLMLRSVASYSLQEYRRFIRPRLGSTEAGLPFLLVAVAPRVLVNVLCTLYYRLSSIPERRVFLVYLRSSPYSLRNWRPFRRCSE